jgi:hypothetical protein
MDRPNSLGRLCVLAVLTIAVSLMGQGCATATQAEIKAMQTRTLTLSYDEAYPAVVNSLLGQGFAIDVSDKQAGVLTSRRRLKGLKLHFGFVAVLPVIMIDRGVNEQAASVLLTPVGEDQTLLRVTLQKNGRPVKDEELATELADRVAREASL